MLLTYFNDKIQNMSTFSILNMRIQIAPWLSSCHFGGNGADGAVETWQYMFVYMRILVFYHIKSKNRERNVKNCKKIAKNCHFLGGEILDLQDLLEGVLEGPGGQKLIFVDQMSSTKSV